jgi:hypothetical protein
LFEGIRWAIELYENFFQPKDEKNLTVESILSFYYLSFLVNFLRETPYNKVDIEVNDYLIHAIMAEFRKVQDAPSYTSLALFFKKVAELALPPELIEGNKNEIRGYWNTQAMSIINFVENHLRPIATNDLGQHAKVFANRLSKTWHLVPPKLYINTKKDINEIRDLLKAYQLCFLISEPIRFDWADSNKSNYFYSSGEANFVKLFSRLDHALKNIITESTPNNILLLLDEAELTMHPAWQRRCIKLLLDYIQGRLPEKHNCQIILTTHSPILLSDLPEGNIIRLERNEKGKVISKRPDEPTFGSNIHRLYKKSFIKNGGLIGAFSKEKIEDLILFLKSEKGVKEDWNSINSIELINLIGEQLIRQRLIDLHMIKFPSKEELLKRRSEIDQQLKDME